MQFANVAKELTATPASYLKAARAIEHGALEDLTAAKIGIVSTFTAQVLAPYLTVECAARGLSVKTYFGPFNQLEQQLLDKQSALYAHEPDVIVVFARLEELAPKLAGRFLPLSEAANASAVDDIRNRFGDWLGGIRRYSNVNILLANFAPPAVLSAGLADASLTVSQTSAVQKRNEAMAALYRQHAGVWLFDCARLVFEHGLVQWTDNRLWPMPDSGAIACANRRRFFVASHEEVWTPEHAEGVASCS